MVLFVLWLLGAKLVAYIKYRVSGFAFCVFTHPWLHLCVFPLFFFVLISSLFS